MDRERYTQIHEAARHYDTKIWAIPAVFFSIIGFIVSQINFTNLLSYQNIFLTLIGFFGSLLLAIQFNKDSFWVISLQDKINEMDEKENFYFPLYALPKSKVRARLPELQKSKFGQDDAGLKGFSYSPIRTLFLRYGVADYVFITILTSAALLFITFLALLYLKIS